MASCSSSGAALAFVRLPLAPTRLPLGSREAPHGLLTAPHGLLTGSSRAPPQAPQQICKTLHPLVFMAVFCLLSDEESRRDVAQAVLLAYFHDVHWLHPYCALLTGSACFHLSAGHDPCARLASVVIGVCWPLFPSRAMKKPAQSSSLRGTGGKRAVAPVKRSTGHQRTAGLKRGGRQAGIIYRTTWQQF